ncbi:MAG TPA: M28 family peptidase [Candidatus Saccharimonadales bacterium]|nr:M28 family peptidase [Candidatus Saccharimonadales bacterium]
MQLNKHLPAFLAFFVIACIPASAQLTPAEPDPLARIRDAAAANVQVCSATGETLCEQVAPKIIANAQGDSPLAENLRRLKETLAERNKSDTEKHAVAWALAAFREAGLDPSIEKYANPNGSAGEVQNVVAEYRGRDKSDEWVLVGAHLGPQRLLSGATDNSCDAAAVIEAARDISLTAMHPKRSIRFVLFTGDGRDMLGAWAYARAHRAELDHARAAILIHSDCKRITGYSINGRPDLESGLREAMKPIEALGANQIAFEATPGTDDFDFILEGVPTLSADPILTGSADSGISSHDAAKVELADLKYNIAVVAVTAFGIAERTAPIGSLHSHAEIESLLVKLGLDAQMKTSEAWKQWESGERGRLP